MDYFFVSKEQFEEWIETGELCEWALVYGEYKGIPKSQVRLFIRSRPCLMLAASMYLATAAHNATMFGHLHLQMCLLVLQAHA